MKNDTKAEETRFNEVLGNANKKIFFAAVGITNFEYVLGTLPNEVGDYLDTPVQDRLKEYKRRGNIKNPAAKFQCQRNSKDKCKKQNLKLDIFRSTSPAP